MDLNLSLSYQEQNDNKAIVLTDTSNINATDTNLANGDSLVIGVMYEIAANAGTLDFTANGASSNDVGTRFVANNTGTMTAGDEATPVTSDASEITAATLDTTITGVDGVPVVKSQVDLYAEFGPFLSQNDMVYTITALLFGDEANSLLIDGLYALTYRLTTPTGVSTLNVTILVYGQVKVATYEKLRNISVLYMCNDGCPSPEISEADLCGAYLSSIENSAYVAKTEELLNMLIVLDNIIKNGSNITW